MCSDLTWRKDCVAIWIPIKSGQRWSGLAILVALSGSVLNLPTTIQCDHRFSELI